ncbi:exonuclease mut-7 homolog [Amphibalanus amphitrite]|uniref:exonuclease mut-7 homolog n=1 Tax=Amphibalanus amphitrite TaxID=1232801 RepID=UPI001C90B910|nr:exonuclease mut-7 homolog [Amphibalanus amphitrite]
MLHDGIRTLAFQAMSGQECTYISDAIVELCDLNGSALMFVDEVHRVLQSKDYKKACQLATRLRLHDQFGVDDFVTPLVLLDRANVAEQFLADSSGHQAAAVTALDDLLERSLPAAASALGMPTFAKDSVNQKTLKKLIERWCKRFSLDVRQAAPRTALFSAKATMNYLFYRRFKEASIKPEDCEDFLIEILADYPELIQDALERLNREGAMMTLYNVALTLGVSHRELPLGLHDLFFRPPERPDEDWAYRQGPAPRASDFYRMPSHVRVELVDRTGQLPSVVRELQLYSGPLGLDAEWKPISVRDVNEVSLLQVATDQTVYVFDLQELSGSSKQMESLGTALLCGNNLKLGFDLASDFDMLEASVPCFGKAILNRKNMMDVKVLGSRVEAAFPDVFPFKEAPAAAGSPAGSSAAAGHKKPKEAAKGLSELVRKCLGRPLDKGEQCSNWKRRPLRPTQLQYAATDAFCLVALYEELRWRLELHHTTPHEVVRCIVTNTNAAPKAAAKAKQKKPTAPAPRGQEELPNAPPPNSRAIRPDAFRAVCDTMVQGLGKKLRSIGADVAILENGDDHDQCVALSRRENRVILTRGRQLHRRMAGMVSTGLCYRVDAEKAADQLEEVVRHFRIDVAPDDVFKRCQYCNCADYWRVPTGVMRRLRDRLAGGGGRGADFCPLEGQGTAQVDLNSGLVRHTSVYVAAAGLHSSTLDGTDTFYVCQVCGHVYWAGSHHGKYVANLGGIIAGGGGGDGAHGGAWGGAPAPRPRSPPRVMYESDSEDDWYY